MNKKWKQSQLGGIVYSTHPEAVRHDEAQEEAVTLSPAQQKLRIWLETKHRGGKAATVVLGFVGSEADAQALGKQLKNLCGTGGSVKDGEIMVQGDHREKVLAWLIKQGYTQTKKAGG